MSGHFVPGTRDGEWMLLPVVAAEVGKPKRCRRRREPARLQKASEAIDDRGNAGRAAHKRQPLRGPLADGRRWLHKFQVEGRAEIPTRKGGWELVEKMVCFVFRRLARGDAAREVVRADFQAGRTGALAEIGERRIVERDAFR